MGAIIVPALKDGAMDVSIVNFRELFRLNSLIEIQQ